MPLSVTLSREDSERLEKILRATGQTTYGFVKDAVLRSIREIEIATPGSGPSETVLDLVRQLHERKWALYQFNDFSDFNHWKWLAGRNLKATKRECQEAVALFRREQEKKV